MAGVNRINPRFRAYGKARLDVTLRAKDEKEWQSMWKAPAHPYPFSFGEGWKFYFEYRVDDYAAEIGFFIDVLGFSVYSFSPSVGQFVSPDQGLFFGVSAVQEGEQSTLSDTLCLRFKVQDLLALVRELEKRGIVFEQPPTPIQEGGSLQSAVFRTPHGILIDLWGEVDQTEAPPEPDDEAKAADLSRMEHSDPELQRDHEREEAEGTSNPAANDTEENEGEDNSVSGKEQIGLWTQFSRSFTGLKDKSQRHAISSNEREEKRTPGNGEITYAPIDEDDSDSADIEDEEEFP